MDSSGMQANHRDREGLARAFTFKFELWYLLDRWEGDFRGWVVRVGVQCGAVVFSGKYALCVR
jgi:hypothetical protein